jgi:hypothetical protein
MKVEKNIPIPKKYPFAEMAVGDSFGLLPGVKRVSVSVAAKRYGEKLGRVFTIRTMPDRTLRCWRVA